MHSPRFTATEVVIDLPAHTVSIEGLLEPVSKLICSQQQERKAFEKPWFYRLSFLLLASLTRKKGGLKPALERPISNHKKINNRTDSSVWFNRLLARPFNESMVR